MEKQRNKTNKAHSVYGEKKNVKTYIASHRIAFGWLLYKLQSRCNRVARKCTYALACTYGSVWLPFGQNCMLRFTNNSKKNILHFNSHCATLERCCVCAVCVRNRNGNFELKTDIQKTDAENKRNKHIFHIQIQFHSQKHSIWTSNCRALCICHLHCTSCMEWEKDWSELNSIQKRRRDREGEGERISVEILYVQRCIHHVWIEHRPEQHHPIKLSL